MLRWAVLALAAILVVSCGSNNACLIQVSGVNSSCILYSGTAYLVNSGLVSQSCTAAGGSLASACPLGVSTGICIYLSGQPTETKVRYYTGSIPGDATLCVSPGTFHTN